MRRTDWQHGATFQHTIREYADPALPGGALRRRRRVPDTVLPLAVPGNRRGARRARSAQAEGVVEKVHEELIREACGIPIYELLQVWEMWARGVMP
jgi:hypothetical protein